jgi:hypothetical protein
VDCEFFVSVEQDVILARDWWKKFHKYMEDETIAVAQGVRVATDPILQKIDEWTVEKKDEKFQRSIDNNIYRTAIFRELNWQGDHGNITVEKLQAKGLKWVVDKNVVSQHIRKSVLWYLEHIYKMHKIDEKGRKVTSKELYTMFKFFLYSPFRALTIVFTKKHPAVIIVYPLIRLAILKAYLERGLI